MSALSASTWGNPTATKRVLLVHGITSSSHFWHRIAREFASRGYFVTAPDLLGHGNARRGSDYTIAALIDELRPLFTVPGSNDHPYDVVVGHSLGGIVAAALLPLLKSARPVRVVLVDPPLELTPEIVAFYGKTFDDQVGNPRTPETYMQECPLWTREDAIFRNLSVRLCDVTAIQSMLTQNSPWSFSNLLLKAPDNVKVVVLAADPSKMACAKEEQLKQFSHVTTKTIWGASHLIPLEFPQVVVETALEGTESQN